MVTGSRQYTDDYLYIYTERKYLCYHSNTDSDRNTEGDTNL